MTDEPFRPHLHFLPKAGWINDPNGLIQIDGIWHLFYQHEPNSTSHGPMHWGHASSSDLVTWTEHQIALYPDEFGTCFSGSAVATGGGEIKLFYTAHRAAADGSDFQVQCLVHADRALTNFSSDAGNPIIENPGLSAFRDPEVLWHEPTARRVMVLTHGQSIGVHSSVDLVHWQLESTFGEGEGRHGRGPWECPDLIRFAATDGTEHWVLIVGIGSDAPGGGSGTQYFVGSFDGRKFINENPALVALWVDQGRDYYAAQSFSGAKIPTTIAWASNWQYARKMPTHASRGTMALPRELSLLNTGQGLRLRQTVPHIVASAFETIAIGVVPRTGTYRIATNLSLAEGPGTTGIRLFGEVASHFVIAPDDDGHLLLRLTRGSIDGAHDFASDYQVAIPSDVGLDIELFVDKGLVDLSLGGGMLWFTNLFFPANLVGEVSIAQDVDQSLEKVRHG